MASTFGCGVGASAGLRWAAAGSGSLLGALLPRWWVLGAISPTLQASGPAGEIIRALGTLGAVAIFASVGTLPVSLPQATPFGSDRPELPVEVCQQTLDVTQGRLGSHSRGDSKAVRLNDTATPEPKRFRT